MRAAVVVSGVHDRWNEAELVGRRIAGALAHQGRVTLLVGGTSTRSWSEGLLDIHQHATAPRNAHRAHMLERALLGPPSTGGVVPPAVRHLEEELFLARGEYAPGLAEELARERFDLVVFAGATTGYAALSGRAVPEGTAVYVAPVPRDRRSLRLGLVVDVLERADAVLTTTDSERDDVLSVLGAGHPVPLRHIGFVARTNELAAQALPNAFPEVPTVVVVTDWEKLPDHDVWSRWAALLRVDLAGAAELRAVGPSANRLPAGFAGEPGGSRIDLWRWTSHALAAVDPVRYSAISVPSLDALSYGTPIVVPADSGAAGRHADAGNCGLWFRTYDEFRGCIELLLREPATRAALGENGRRYAETTVGDTEAFVKAVLEATLAA